ncbi:MAG TPA: endonuclease/exonuclease/phosphatase family protein, partial [Nitrospiraceae bacterium]|nr:endonuclease/exonuclease/phosphatase family protein [Nitrospiraceae bacterium]
YNTLHGLEVGRYTVRPGESDEEHAARLAIQIEQMTAAAPDLMLLQEVNPLPGRARMYVDGLKKSGLDYDEVHQVDACGIRLIGNVAVVPGLNNGLVVLAKAPLRIRKLEGLKLSGGLGGCQDSTGVQFGELRYALIAEVENPATRRKVLAVSLHLHSGIERDEYFTQRIVVGQLEGRIPNEGESREILAALAQDQERRLEELRTLVRNLQTLQTEGHYAGVVVGGDFNFEPDSPEYRALQAAGLKDTFLLSRHTGELYSYNPKNNPVAQHEEVTLPPALSSIVQAMPEADREKIVAGYRQGIAMSRRIDFLFVMRSGPADPNACLRQELFGTPRPVTLDVGSDHYGVLDTYTTDGSDC